MLSTVNFQILSSRATQCFFKKEHRQASSDDYVFQKVLTDNRSSVVGISMNSSVIIKIIKPRRWHERIKITWGHSRYHKELKSNILLKALGFRVPEIYANGIGYGCLIGKPYLGFYLMENLAIKGFIEVEDYFFERTPDNLRSKIFANLMKDLATLKKNHLVYNDLHLNNLMARKSGEIAWIDTGVTHYPFYKRYRFSNKFNDSINRLLSSKSAKSLMPQEQQQLRELLL